MTNDPFQMGSPPPAQMTFWKTVWAVALGIILSMVLLAIVSGVIGLSLGLFTAGLIKGAKDAHRREQIVEEQDLEKRIADLRRQLRDVGETNVTIEVEKKK